MARQSSSSALGVAVADGETDDLATLTNLNESIMLKQLRKRYERDMIYTYVGDILVAINPFKQLKIYDREHVMRYKRTKKSQLPPHVYAMADAAYSTMIDSAHNQCCVISGESGAGKTESTKLLINQIIELCPTRTTIGLEQKVIQVNPLLEAFGNAQTVMNDNSSRFGKYIQLKFKAGQVLGAKINEYLLEKSRVVGQSKGEENFHVFYYMFAGLSKEELQEYRLKDADQYRYLSQGESCLTRRRKECKEFYHDLLNAMDLVGFTEDNQNNVFQVMAIVLHMGNVEFVEGPNDSSRVKNADCLQDTAGLLGIQAKVLESFLTTHETMTAGETITINLTKQKAEDARDAMAKALYGRVFSWIINRVNSLLAPQEDNLRGEGTEIGILDIFGFEHFEKNSFEQCCINVANEQLQFFFNEHIFKWEQEEYRKEGVDWKEIVYLDNKPLLNLFLEKPIGLFSLLDEESRFPKATDLSFVGKLNQHFSKVEYYVPSKDTRTPLFVVKHYAGEVKYDGDGFLEKNRDSLPSGAVELLQISKNDLIHDIFMATLTRTGTMALKSRRGRSRKTRNRLQAAGRVSRTGQGKSTSLKSLTVSAQFKNSLTILMEKMNQCNPHFIRCIKPNMGKRANDYQDEFVVAQLRYTGMLETTRIRREGFAIRPAFSEFVNRFKHLANMKIMEDANGSRKILQAADIKGYHIGKTKVFLKYFHIDQLTDKLERIHRAATMWQKVIRGHVDRRRVKKLWEKARVEKTLLGEFLARVPDGLVRTSKRMQAIMSADFKRPADYFVTKTMPKQSSKPLLALNDMDLPPPPLPEPTRRVDDDDDDDDDEDEFDENDEVKPMPISKKHGKFGREGTKAASVRWFKETQLKSGVKTDEGNFQAWFHGIITRRRAEQLLTSKENGSFLVRVSESRFGYSLSFRVATRVKHFMIDQTMSGKYIVVGEPKVHKSLGDLVAYHKNHGIGESHEILILACGQDDDADDEDFDYADLMDHGGEQALMFRSPSGVSHGGGGLTSSPNMRRRVASGAHSHSRSQQRTVSTHSSQADMGGGYRHHMHDSDDPRNRRHATNPPQFAAPQKPSGGGRVPLLPGQQMQYRAQSSMGVPGAGGGGYQRAQSHSGGAPPAGGYRTQGSAPGLSPGSNRMAPRNSSPRSRSGVDGPPPLPPR